MKKLAKKHLGIRLDVGCGINKQRGYIGMDIVRHPKVDIVHDVQKFPWPIDTNSCFQVLMSHLWEHIEPKFRFRLMDELWRIIRPEGQLLISAPYAGSWGDSAHPAHYKCPNEATFTFFDPDYPLYQACSYKKPKPWKITRNEYDMRGCVEVIMEPRKNAKRKIKSK